MSWIRKTDGGNYKVCWRDPEGKTRSKTFALAGDARAYRDKVGNEIREGSYVDPARGKVRFGEFWTGWLAGADIRPTTRDRYERHYRLYLEPEFAHRRLNSITPEHVRAWKTAMGEVTGRSTVASALRLLKTVLNAAVNDERITRSPARSIRNPSPDPKGGMRVLEAEEVAVLAEAIDPRWRALIYLLGYRGLRIGEAAALRVGDVDTMRGLLTVDKTLTDVAGQLLEGKPKTDAGIRTVSLPSFLREILSTHIAEFSSPTDPTAYVFSMPGGGPGRREGEGGPLRVNNWRRRSFADAVEVMLRSVDDPKRRELLAGLTPHDLRDTAATLAFGAKASVKEVSTMLGHANPAITLKIYTGVLESMSKETDDALDAAFRKASVPSPTTSPATVVSLTG
jgi:integrase